MHELTIAQNIINQVECFVKNSKTPNKVRTINVRIGKLSSIVPQSLQFAFDILADETALRGVKLVIEEVAVCCICRQCNNLIELDGPAFQCPVCKSYDLEIKNGQELLIDSLEVD